MWLCSAVSCLGCFGAVFSCWFLGCCQSSLGRVWCGGGQWWGGGCCLTAFSFQFCSSSPPPPPPPPPPNLYYHRTGYFVIVLCVSLSLILCTKQTACVHQVFRTYLHPLGMEKNNQQYLFSLRGAWMSVMMHHPSVFRHWRGVYLNS